MNVSYRTVDEIPNQVPPVGCYRESLRTCQVWSTAIPAVVARRPTDLIGSTRGKHHKAVAARAALAGGTLIDRVGPRPVLAAGAGPMSWPIWASPAVASLPALPSILMRRQVVLAVAA